MAYCSNCKVRESFQDGLCYECKQKMLKRSTGSSSPHGRIVYDKYDTRMSEVMEFKQPESSALSSANAKKEKRTKTPIIGELLTPDKCKGYTFYKWSKSEDIPVFNSKEDEYYYVLAKAFDKTHKLQVVVNHVDKIVYLSSKHITKKYARAGRAAIMKILSCENQKQNEN